MKPITEFQNYFFTDSNQLSGIAADDVEIITVVDNEDNPIQLFDFFSKSGDLYFHIKDQDNSDPENPVTVDKYFCQSSGIISEITSLPDNPAISRSQFVNADYSIENFTYEGTLCSDVRNLLMESGIERFFMVDGYSLFEGAGFYFNVSDGRYNEETMVREPGLYFWPINRKGISRIKEKGNIW